MMETLIFPDIFFFHKEQGYLNQNLFFYNYTAESESVKNKVVFKKNMFNFILTGHKIIHTLDRSFHIDHTKSLIIRNGNCLTSEKYSGSGSFNSLTLFFDTKIIQDFLIKYSGYFIKFGDVQHPMDCNVYIFEKDLFIENYIDSVKQLIDKNKPVPVELIRLKFEEIMLYLLHKNGETFFAFIKNLIADLKEIDFRIKMENESLNKLTLEEMAFLCNMSLSTFKRNFLNTFGVSPQKWFQNKRLQFAYESLKSKTKTPSELYLELGYSSLSSFSVAFTNIFGVPPTKVQ